MEDKETILKKRANFLARSRSAPVQARDSREVVEFRIGEERYGLESRWVKAVFPLGRYTSLPGVPAHILGVINLRGQVICLLDMASFFDFSMDRSDPYHFGVFLQSKSNQFAIGIHEVTGSRSISMNRLQTKFPTLHGIREKYLAGITPDGLVLLEGSKLLTDSSMIVNHSLG